MSRHEPWTENEWMNWDSLCEAQYVIALREHNFRLATALLAARAEAGKMIQAVRLCDEATEKVKRGR
jgi:hypothetical protein